MRIRHPIDSQETQEVINKSFLFSFKKRCSTLEDLLFSKESIEEVKLVLSKKDDDLDMKIKPRSGKNSIFVESFLAIRTFPARLNYYDPVEKRMIQPSVMLKAHLTCSKQVDNLPRKIVQKYYRQIGIF